eukprot:12724401-Prorocentrum_lima.AAC.1
MPRRAHVLKPTAAHSPSMGPTAHSHTEPFHAPPGQKQKPRHRGSTPMATAPVASPGHPSPTSTARGRSSSPRRTPVGA